MKKIPEKLNLPEYKIKELEQIKSLILKECDDVEMIILYGSYARGDWREEKDLPIDRKSGSPSDYDILVVTKEKETALNAGIWSEITTKAYRLKLSAYTTITAHDIFDINIKLFEGQYFYSDIKKEGITLYDSGNFELASEGKLSTQDRKRVASEHYDYWFNRSKEFFIDYKNGFERKSYEAAAFNMHQVCEHAYKAILLVFTNYCPQEHFLRILGEDAQECSKKLKNIFPCKTKEEKDLFKMLDYAYIGGRYDPTFKVRKEQLQILEKSVERLLKITEEICIKKIESFKE